MTKRINKIDKALKPDNVKLPKIVYKYKGYETSNILLYPLMIILVAHDSLQNKIDKLVKWSDEKAIKILDKYLVEVAFIDRELQEISYCFSWGTSNWYHAAKLWDKRWCKKFDRELVSFLFNSYTIDGYEKIITSDWYETWITFKKKEIE